MPKLTPTENRRGVGDRRRTWTHTLKQPLHSGTAVMVPSCRRAPTPSSTMWATVGLLGRPAPRENARGPLVAGQLLPMLLNQDDWFPEPVSRTGAVPNLTAHRREMGKCQNGGGCVQKDSEGQKDRVCCEQDCGYLLPSLPSSFLLVSLPSLLSFHPQTFTKNQLHAIS